METVFPLIMFSTVAVLLLIAGVCWLFGRTWKPRTYWGHMTSHVDGKKERHIRLNVRKDNLHSTADTFMDQLLSRKCLATVGFPEYENLKRGVRMTQQTRREDGTSATAMIEVRY